MSTFPERFPANRRRAAFLIVAAIQLASLAACGGGGGYGGGGGNTPVTGVGPSKLFAADSTHSVVGSLANPDPAAGALTVDRLIGPQPGAFQYNYAMFSTNIGSLALDTTRDYLYAGNGTSVLVFHAASAANGDLFTNATIGPIGNTGSMFLDSVHDLLYVGDDVVGVKAFNGASTASGSPSPRSITGDFGTTFQIHGVAVDTTSNNFLYVSNTNHTTSSDQISVFNNATTVTGSNPPDRTITPNPASSVGGISLDTVNNLLYVAGGSASTSVMVFDHASTANGSTAPLKVLSAFPSGIVNVVVDPVHNRLYAIGLNGHIYLVENVSTLSSGAATAKDASVTGGTLTALVINPN